MNDPGPHSTGGRWFFGWLARSVNLSSSYAKGRGRIWSGMLRTTPAQGQLEPRDKRSTVAETIGAFCELGCKAENAST